MSLCTMLYDKIQLLQYYNFLFFMTEAPISVQIDNKYKSKRKTSKTIMQDGGGQPVNLLVK